MYNGGPGGLNCCPRCGEPLAIDAAICHRCGFKYYDPYSTVSKSSLREDSYVDDFSFKKIMMSFLKNPLLIFLLISLAIIILIL